MIATTYQGPQIDFTDTALEEVIRKIERQGVKGVRFGLTGGGCAGFSYEFDYASEGKENDIPIDFGKFTLWLDPLSEMYLTGTIISWKVEGLNEGFEFVNPQEQSACGCGVSVGF
jgi:iron-sulfur cluster assembly accessory protein